MGTESLGIKEEKVKTSSAVWLGVANAGTGLLCA